MIGRMHHVVLDCPDPDALAAFYSALLGLPVTYRDDDWVVVASSDTSSGLAFQRAPDNPTAEPAGQPFCLDDGAQQAECPLPVIADAPLIRKEFGSAAGTRS